MDTKKKSYLKKRNKLAIVIPFYKISFFDELMSALARQTNLDFILYVGDDFSSDNPVNVLSKYSSILNIVYKRFDERLGNISLTAQWMRCINLIDKEEWFWLLPDDDLPSSTCVEDFYQALNIHAANNVKVFRIPMYTINANSCILSKCEVIPVLENNYQFYNRILQGAGSASLGDNIFNRQSFDESMGFVDFPKAWLSDHAAILSVSAGGNIAGLVNSSLGFRMSGENVSSHVDDADLKVEARIRFVNWLKENINIFPERPTDEFFRFLYWKAEYYALYEWPFSYGAWLKLYKLKVLCFGSFSPLPIAKLAMIKVVNSLRNRYQK